MRLINTALHYDKHSFAIKRNKAILCNIDPLFDTHIIQYMHQQLNVTCVMCLTHAIKFKIPCAELIIVLDDSANPEDFNGTIRPDQPLSTTSAILSNLANFCASRNSRILQLLSL